MFRALITLLLLAYPVAVYFGLQWLSVRHVALVIIVLLLLRMTWMRQLRVLQGLQWPVLGGVTLVALALLFDSKLTLKLYPAMVNAVLLGWFLLTLYQGPPAIERFARLQDPDLAESGVRYTRTVTKVWCGFFILNGGIALATALLGSDFWWMLYNGLIAYLLMGVLFAGEWLVRQRIRQRNAQS